MSVLHRLILALLLLLTVEASFNEKQHMAFDKYQAKHIYEFEGVDYVDSTQRNETFRTILTQAVSTVYACLITYSSSLMSRKTS